MTGRKEQKRQLWRIMVAERCFERVRDMCELFVREKPDPNSTLGYALIGAIAATYIKPFTRNKKAGPLSPIYEQYSDPQKAKAHRLLKHVRHNLYAHQNQKHARVQIDVKAFDEGDSIRYEFYQGLSQDHLNPKWIETILQMVKEALLKFEAERMDLMKELFGRTHWPTGVIELNLDDES